jgi:hypothetical protein
MSKILRCTLVTVMCLLAIAPAFAAGSNSLMITQFYSQGGKTGSYPSTFMENFVELYNNGTAEIDLTTGNWTIQFQNGTGAMSTSTSYYLGGPSFLYYNGTGGTNGFNGHLKPGQFLLIMTPGGQGGAGTGHLYTTIVPDISLTAATPTVSGSTAAPLWTAAAGQIAVVNSTTPVTCTANNPVGAADFIGYGTGTTCYEGTVPETVLANNARYTRANWRGGSTGTGSTGDQSGTGSNICTNLFDTDVNSADLQQVGMTAVADTNFRLHNSIKVAKWSGTAWSSTTYSPVICGVSSASSNPVAQGGVLTFSVGVVETTSSLGPYNATVDMTGITAGGLTTDTLTGSGATLNSPDETIPAGVAQGAYTVKFSGSDSNGNPLTIPNLRLTVGPKPQVDLVACATCKDVAYNKSKTFTTSTVLTGTQTAQTCTITTPATYTVSLTSAPGVPVAFPWPVGNYTVTPSAAASSDCVIVNYVSNTFNVTPSGAAPTMKCGSSNSATYTGSPIACTLSLTPRRGPQARSPAILYLILAMPPQFMAPALRLRPTSVVTL